MDHVRVLHSFRCIFDADERSAGHDPQWAKPPAWAKKDGDELPATESHTGEGTPAAADGKVDGAQAEQPAGQTAPAAQ